MTKLIVGDLLLTYFSNIKCMEIFRMKNKNIFGNLYSYDLKDPFTAALENYSCNEAFETT